MNLLKSKFLILALPLLAFVTGGCAKDAKVAVKQESVPQANNASSAPLTPLTDDDYKVRTVHELMRVHMASMNLLNPPKPGTTEGCITFSAGNAKISFSAKYDCTWNEISSEPAHGGMTWSLKNEETYKLNLAPGIPYQASASFKVLAIRDGSKKIAVNAGYSRAVNMFDDPKNKGQMKVFGQSSFGLALDNHNQNWQTKFDGSWIIDTTKGLTLAAGSIVTFTHNLPESKKINETVVTYTVGDKGLYFDPTVACSHPIGTMTWTKKYNKVDATGATATGTLILTQQGASDGTTDQTWPTDSCLEFEARKL